MLREPEYSGGRRLDSTFGAVIASCSLDRVTDRCTACLRILRSWQGLTTCLQCRQLFPSLTGRGFQATAVDRATPLVDKSLWDRLEHFLALPHALAMGSNE